MKLHHETDLRRDMRMNDSEGKPFRAITVFTEAIRYIKSHLIKKLKNALAFEIKENEITWVLTVPAIWRESAKQFMREAANEAGIANKNLKLALEPESAAIFCKEQAIHKADGADGLFLSAFNPGQKYLVADLGGGTLDTTVHEVSPDGLLKELHAATGGAWGGQLVNIAFEDLLKEIVGSDIFDKFCYERAGSWITLQKNFENKKREFTPHTDLSDIDIPRGLADMYKEKTKKELQGKFLERNIQILKDDILRLPANEMRRLFAVATDNIIEHIEKLFQKEQLRDVSTILLVGGFSDSVVVKESILKQFQLLRVITPGSLSSAILHGAVMYGINDRIIAARISPYTYGLHTRKVYNDKIHPKDRMTLLNDRQIVTNAFSKQIEKGETVYVGADKPGTSFTIVNRNKSNVFWRVYQTEAYDPIFCDEPGCSSIGTLSIQIPKHIKADKIRLRVYMTCQGTELHATAENRDLKFMAVGIFNFLDKDYMYSGDIIAD